MGGPDLATALWLLPVALPISIYVAWSDLRRMKIPNRAVYILAGSFVVLGFVALPLDTYMWRLTHLPVLLVIGMVLNALRVLGAGDAKFIAAASPYVAVGDFGLMCYILAGAFIGGYVTHRLAKNSPLRALAPNWESWQSGKRFPMGFPLGMALVFYLALPLFWPA